MIWDGQRKTVLKIEMLKQVQHDALLDTLNDLDLPTSILKPLTPAFALTTHNLQLGTDILLFPTRNPRPRSSKTEIPCASITG